MQDLEANDLAQDTFNFLHTKEDWRKLDREIREEELEEAMEKGEMKNKITMAKKCLSKNMDISLIMELTGLTEKEILSLKN